MALRSQARSEEGSLRTEPSDMEQSVWQPVSRRRNWRVRPWVWGVFSALFLLAVAMLIYAYWPTLRTGAFVQIDQGQVHVQMGPGAPWYVAEVGKLVREGSYLEAAPGTVALIRFFDGSMMRIESEGAWRIVSLRGSRNGRLSRIVVRQIRGRASFVSAPMRRGFDARLQVELLGNVAELVGVATFDLSAEGKGRVSVLQGRCRFTMAGQQVGLLGGQEAVFSQKEVTVLSAP